MDLNMKAIGNQEIQLWDHSISRLRKFWQHAPLVLVFLRHYG